MARSTELKLVIAKIAGMMGERGFPLKDLEASLQSVKNLAAEDMVTTSKSGAELRESPLDQLRRVANADIIMELTWSVNKRGPFQSVSFILRALDAYTNKQVAESVGTDRKTHLQPYRYCWKQPYWLIWTISTTACKIILTICLRTAGKYPCA